MFGRRMFMVAGNLAVGVAEHELMVRVGVEARHEALSHPRTRECDMSRRPMYDWVLVGAEGVATEDELAGWLQRGVLFARTLSFTADSVATASPASRASTRSGRSAPRRT